MTSDPIDLRSHKVLAGVSRVAILEVLRTGTGPQDVQAIAAKVGLHTNTVRAHLDQLIDAGLVETAVQPRRSPGRPRVLFSASRTDDSIPSDSYQLLAGLLASTIDGSASTPGSRSPRAAAADAGRRWGHTLVESGDAAQGPVDAAHALERIVAVLDDVGFAPKIGAAADLASAAPGLGGRPAHETVIELRRCPFREVALKHSDVVCGVHLGLMQGAMEQMGAPPASIRLEPFARPDLCLAYVSSADAVCSGGAA